MAAPAISPRYVDKQFVVKLVGHCVMMRGDAWVVELAQRVHPKLQDALAYTRSEVVSVDTQSQRPKAMRRRGRPTKPEREQPAVVEPIEGTIGLDELQGYAAKVFPDWEDYRREPWIEAVVKDKGCSVMFQALQRAQENGKPIRKPWSWLKKVISDISSGREG